MTITRAAFDEMVRRLSANRVRQPLDSVCAHGVKTINVCVDCVREKFSDRAGGVESANLGRQPESESKPSRQSRYKEAIVTAFFLSHGLPAPSYEVVFAPPRKFRFDLCWVVGKVALEVDGSIWTNGRHTRGSGWIKDTEKLNLAASLGWRMLRCTPQQLQSREIIEIVKKCLDYNPP